MTRSSIFVLLTLVFAGCGVDATRLSYHDDVQLTPADAAAIATCTRIDVEVENVGNYAEREVGAWTCAFLSERGYEARVTRTIAWNADEEERGPPTSARPRVLVQYGWFTMMPRFEGRIELRVPGSPRSASFEVFQLDGTPYESDTKGCFRRVLAEAFKYLPERKAP